MSITLEYKNLPTSMVTPAYVLGDAQSHSVDVKAPSEFVKDMMFPVLRSLASGDAMKTRPYVYSYFKAILQMDDNSKPVKCGMAYLRKSRNYMDAFNIFSTYGINLSGIWLIYDEAGKTLYVPKKVFQFVSRISAKDQANYVMMLMYYYRFLKALVKTDNDWKQCTIGNENTFQIPENTLKEIVNAISPTSDCEEINLDYIRDDLTFKSLVYAQGAKSSDFPLATNVPSIPENGFSYNILESNGKRYLAIINKMFQPMAYYVIYPERSAIFTNSLLQMWNCTAEGAELLPLMARICAESFSPNDGNRAFAVANLECETLLDTVIKGDFEIIDDTTGFEAVLDRFPTFTENSDPTVFNAACSKIKVLKSSAIGGLQAQYENDEYAQKLYSKNLPYYDTFPLKNISNLVKGVVASDDSQVYSMFFKGDTGTGKSTAARVIFYKAGLPWVSINCSTNIDEADIFGCMIPNPEKKSADDPEFVWEDGPATKCIRNGYGLIVEEANGARPGVLLKFNSLLDEARQIELGNGEVLKAHPNFRIVFTANIAYEGTNELNMALVDRFDAIVEFSDMSKQDAIETIKKRTGYSDVTKIEKVYGVYEAIKKYSNENNLGIAISIRRLLCIFTKGKYFKTAKDAVENMLLEHAFIRDNEHKEYFVNSVLPAFDLNFKI